MARDAWRPGLPSDVSAIVLALMALQAVNRGIDYAMGDRDTTTASLTVVEQAMPLPVWGVLFFLGGVLVLSGMWRRIADLIVIGAVLLMALYASLSWGLVLKMVKRGTSVHDFFDALGNESVGTIVSAWPWDGWRTPASFFVIAFVWACIAWGTRVMQRARGDGHE